MKNQIFALLLTVLFISGCSEPEEPQVDIEQYLTAAADFSERGQFQSAMIEIRNAIQAAPDSAAAYQQMAAILSEIGQQRQAVTTLEGISELNTEGTLLLARAYLEVGKVRSARETLTSEKLSSESNTAQYKLLLADIYLAERDLESAITTFRAVLSDDPNNTDAYLGLANGALFDSDFATARERLNELFAIDPTDAKALLLLSRLEQRAGDLEAEETYLMQAISSMQTTDIITPLRYSILVGLRDNLTKQGKSSEALLYSGLLAESLPDADVNQQQMQAAVELLEAGKFEEARATLDEFLERAPDSQPAITMLAVIDFLQGDERAASIKFEDVIDPETSSPVALQLFAVTELRLNNADKVIETLEKDIDSSNDSKLNALYAVALASSGRLEESETYFLKSIEWEPDTGRLYLPLARLYNQQQKTDEALGSLRTAFEKDPQEPLVQRSLLAQLLSMGDKKGADTVIDDIIKRFGDKQQSWMLAASYYLQDGDLGEGDKALAKALEIEPSLIAEHQRARIRLQQENYSDAIKRYNVLVESNAEDSDAYKGLITAYELSDNIDNGISELRTLHIANKSNALALVLSEYYGRNGELQQAEYWLGQFEGEPTPQSLRISESLIISNARNLLVDGKTSEGRDILLEGLKQYPESNRILGSLITLMISDKNLDEAQRYLNQLSELTDEPIVSLLTGDLESAKGNFLAARTAYTEAWKVVPSDQTAFKVFSVMQSGKRTPEEISAFLEEWVTIMPNSAAAGVTQAGFLYSVGDLSESAEIYIDLIAQNPNNVIAHNNLAWIYGEDDIEKALASGKAAYELAGNRPEIIDTYGWFLYKSGDAKGAEKLLAEAARLAPDNEEIAGHLAEVRAAL